MRVIFFALTKNNFSKRKFYAHNFSERKKMTRV